MDRWDFKPIFGVLLHGECQRVDLYDQTKASLDRQVYPHWLLLTAADDQSQIDLGGAECDYIAIIRAGDQLSDATFFRFAEALQTLRADIIYGDEDSLAPAGTRERPWFKPRWNEELFLATDYISNAIAIESGLARSVHAQNVQSLIVKSTAHPGARILHVPYVLSHVRGSITTAENRARWNAINERVEREGGRCEAGLFDTIKVEWPLPAELPLVSIIVPTKDHLDVLRPCVESTLGRTTYENFELLIVDNGSVEPDTLRFLEEISVERRVRLLRYPGPYNFSAINNAAARAATGSLLCLLNNDTEVVTPDWLTEMVRHAVRPQVGAVGAKLLYGDGSIQHAGVVIGLGGAAGHAHRFLPDSSPGYFKMAHITHQVSAVTTACMVVAKDKFFAAGGLDEEHFAVAFNDVDLCLRLQDAGWHNVYVPHAVLLHHESKSRGDDMTSENFERYSRELRALQERWRTADYQDPVHNPNLDRNSETFALRI